MRNFLHSATIVATIVLGYGFAEAETSVLLDVDFSENARQVLKMLPRCSNTPVNFHNSD